MPYAPVDQNGTQLYYEDTGVPAGQNVYTTLVLIHGAYYNSGTFNPLTAYATANNLRLILLNQRDNKNSTPLTASEIQTLHCGDKEEQEEYMKQRVLELAEFLRWFIEREGIPRGCETEGGKHGGLSVAAWSSGNCLIIPFLGFAECIPAATRSILNQYLRSFIIYDAPHYATGTPYLTLEECWSPITDTSLTPTLKAQLFPPWNSGYYSHSPSTLSAFSTPTYSDLPTRAEFTKGLNHEYDETPRPTAEKVTAEELPEISDLEGVSRSHIPLVFVDRKIYRKCLKSGLFDAKIAQNTFPNVRVETIVCARSPGVCVFAGMDIYQMVLKKRAEGAKVGRKVGVRLMGGWNHHAHREVPEEVMKVFAELA